MITPVIGIQVRQDKPVFSRRQSFAKQWYYRVVDWATGRRFRTEMELGAELDSLFRRVCSCQDRRHLQKLLGRPDFAVAGMSYQIEEKDGQTIAPDIVECYSVSRMQIEIWYYQGHVMSMTAFLVPRTDRKCR